MADYLLSMAAGMVLEYLRDDVKSLPKRDEQGECGKGQADGGTRRNSQQNGTPTVVLDE